MATTSTGSLSSAGIGSGLDVNSIVQKLMSTEQGPLNLVNDQISAVKAQISAYGTLKSSMATFQTAVSNLSSIAKFSAQTATSADTSVFTATASGSAVAGNYSIAVQQLAQPQKLGLAGVASPYTAIGSGTLTISFGTYDSVGNTFTPNANKAAKSLTIDPANSSLASIRDAINNGDLGVTASIVNDGTNNRLVLTSKDSGAANSIKITVADGDGNNLDNSGLSQLAYDPTLTAGAGKNFSELQAAKSAIFDVDGVRVTKPSNVVSDAVDGITFTLLKAQPATAVNLSVDRDQTTITNSVTAFVKAYNDINQSLRNLTKYDSTGKANGPLLGDATARSIATQINGVLTKVIGSSGSLTSLSQIGVAFQRDGTLALDSSKLTTAIQNNFDDIARLFAATGKASDSQLLFTGQGAKTQPGSYAVTVTQLATQGSLSGVGAPNLTITQGVNDQLNLSIDGVNVSLTLSAGTYGSAAALAQEVQTRIAATGSSAKVSSNGGQIQVTSANYGASSAITVQGGNAASDLFGGSPSAVNGVDVAGTVNGAAATGLGQTLKGATGDTSEGLLVKVVGGALGARGTITYSQGYAYQLNTLVQNMLADNGLLTTRTTGLNDSITRLNKQQASIQERLTQIEANYRKQFTALDTLMSSLQQTSSFMTQQIAQIQANSKA